MSALLQLPNEVLLKIIDDTPFIATKAICLSCKTLHALAQDKLLKLAKRKAEFSTVASGGYGGPFSQSNETYQDKHPILWLRDILAFADVEDIASYPTSMVVKFDVSLDCENEDLPGDEKDFLVDFEERIIETIVDVYGDFQREDGSLGARVSEGIFLSTREASLALLITLLPNLRTLTVFADEEINMENDFYHTINGMVNSYSGESPGCIQGCRKLSEVRLSGHENGDVMSGAMICPFLAMPSVSIIKCKGIDSDVCYEGGPWHWPSEEHVSNVIDLELSSSALLSRRVTGYLSYITALQRFAYHFDYAISDYGELEWDPCDIIEALRAYARESLVHLELTANTPTAFLEQELMDDYISDLRDFDNLQTLRLQTTSISRLVEEVAAVDMEYQLKIEPEIVEKTQSKQIGKSRRPVRLIDLLPSSIETVTLVGDSVYQANGGDARGPGEGEERTAAKSTSHCVRR